MIALTGRWESVIVQEEDTHYFYPGEQMVKGSEMATTHTVRSVEN